MNRTRGVATGRSPFAVLTSEQPKHLVARRPGAVAAAAQFGNHIGRAGQQPVFGVALSGTAVGSKPLPNHVYVVAGPIAPGGVNGLKRWNGATEKLVRDSVRSKMMAPAMTGPYRLDLIDYLKQPMLSSTSQGFKGRVLSWAVRPGER